MYRCVRVCVCVCVLAVVCQAFASTFTVCAAIREEDANQHAAGTSFATSKHTQKIRLDIYYCAAHMSTNSRCANRTTTLCRRPDSDSKFFLSRRSPAFAPAGLPHATYWAYRLLTSRANTTILKTACMSQCHTGCIVTFQERQQFLVSENVGRIDTNGTRHLFVGLLCGSPTKKIREWKASVQAKSWRVLRALAGSHALKTHDLMRSLPSSTSLPQTACLFHHHQQITMYKQACAL